MRFSVCLYMGGELISNNTVEAQDAVQKAGFLYNTTRGPCHYYFPYRLEKDDETFEATYQMNTNFGDIRIPCSERYAEDFYNEAMLQVRLASKDSGILVMMLHPTYFNFVSYLLNYTNLIKLSLFLPIYFNRLVKARREL